MRRTVRRQISVRAAKNLQGSCVEKRLQREAVLELALEHRFPSAYYGIQSQDESSGLVLSEGVCSSPPIVFQNVADAVSALTKMKTRTA